MLEIKRFFRAIPFFQRAVHALFRIFPKLQVMYLRLFLPLVNQNAQVCLACDKEAVAKQNIPFPRKRPLTPHAAIIYRDLKTVTLRNKTSAEATSHHQASSPKGLS